MHIRAYRDSDLPLLCQIFLRAVRETACRDYTPGQIAARAQVDETRWRQKLADSIGTVAVVNSQPVGFITAIGTHIDLLFVSPDRARRHRRRAYRGALRSVSSANPDGGRQHYRKALFYGSWF